MATRILAYLCSEPESHYSSVVLPVLEVCKVRKYFDHDSRFFYQKKTSFEDFVSLVSRPTLPKACNFA